MCGMIFHAVEASQPNQGFIGGSLEYSQGKLTVTTGTPVLNGY